MSMQAASEFCARYAIQWRESTIDDVRVRYIRHLREIAAGRAATGDLDLAAERARLARAQAEKVEMQNAITRRELAPITTLELALARLSRQIAAILEAIPVVIKRRIAISAEGLEAIEQEIAKARNQCASVRLEEEIDDDGSDRDQSGDPERTEAA